MEENFVRSAMVQHLAPAFPEFSLFFIFNIVSTIAITYFCLARFASNNYVVARLSFVFLSFLFLFYQVPLVIFSEEVKASLANYWGYSLVVNGGALFLAFWLSLTHSLDFKKDVTLYPEKANYIYVVAGLFSIVFMGTYLSSVAWNCTGLYALLFDPWLTMLAREFSVKLIGTSFSTYSLGAYANAAAPVFILLSVWLIGKSAMSFRIAGTLVGVLGGFLAIAMALVSGTKGLLIPTMLMLMAGAYFWCRTWPSRIVSVVLSVAFIVFSLVVFEFLKERSSNVGENYDFAACSAQAGTCTESLELLESMKSRNYSLGLHEIYVEPIHSRLQCLCGQGGSVGSCSPGTLPQSLQLKLAEAPGAVIVSQPQTLVAPLIGSIFNRIFVVPFQVSVWHFMYAETEPINGKKTLPFSRRLFGDSLNMPELVYQKYGAIYARGDRTSTSTAPTSFFLTYPAYLGWLGFFLAIFCVICMDIFLSRLAILIQASLVPILIGTVLIMCMNFMTSDFVTVLISHGGAAGVFLLIVFSLINKRLEFIRNNRL